jgi:hypothetical protein
MGPLQDEFQDVPQMDDVDGQSLDVMAAEESGISVIIVGESLEF